MNESNGPIEGSNTQSGANTSTPFPPMDAGEAASIQLHLDNREADLERREQRRFEEAKEAAAEETYYGSHSSYNQDRVDYLRVQGAYS